MRKPESIQERMAQVRKAQAAGTYTRCPRCGENTMKLGDRLCTNALSRQYGVTEQLKAENQMEWVRQMNACKVQAEARPSQILCKGCKQPGFAALDIRLHRRYGREKAASVRPLPPHTSFCCLHSRRTFTQNSG